MSSTHALDREIAVLTAKLKRRQLSGFHQTAPRTAELMRSVVVHTRWQSPAQLIERLQAVGAELVRAAPQELCIGNIVRRVLHIVREEIDGLVREQEREAASSVEDGTTHHASTESHSAAAATAAPPLQQPMPAPFSTAPSLHNLLASDMRPEDATRSASGDLSGGAVHDIKQPIIDGVNELIDELGTLVVNIAEQAPEHIHAREVILTLGRSRIVEAFLKRVARTERPFEVIVADTAPSYEGADTARRLSEAGIQATLITDAAVFALMARINKVIIGTHAVMADGGLLAPAGAHAVALAAQHHSVPFVVCAGIPQLTPIFPSDADDFNVLLSPASVLAYEDTGALEINAGAHPAEHGRPTDAGRQSHSAGREGAGAGVFAADSPSPAYDYIPPELISLFITNIGGTHASYIYRLLAEFYSTQDIELPSLNPTTAM
mmetsp:Transcript_16791/g.43444  ORF Transcript_16791/g.43444 Transcript_16791/m.43444 type:complete len:436 (+) Transcript_16791:64-1371(+)